MSLDMNYRLQIYSYPSSDPKHNPGNVETVSAAQFYKKTATR